MISFTIHHKDLNVKLEDKYHLRVANLIDRAEAKSNGYITVALTLPKKNGTDAQNRTFHALLNEFYISGLHSYKSYEDMRDNFKLRGGGAKEYLYILLENGFYRQHTCKLLDDIPNGCVWCKIPKSWTEFTREERTITIQLLITEGNEAGMNSNHWDEIIEGMND